MRELPPGQRAVHGFPRFGVDTRSRPPTVLPGSAIEVDVESAVEGGSPVSLTPQLLATLPRVERDADLHCVAGWSAVGLTWGGWSFRDVYDRLVAPALPASAEVGHLVFVGADGYRSIVTYDDAVAANVLLADRLDGEPLPPEHGAPVRLVSPDQYGFISTKHLCRIELHRTAPPAFFHPQRSIQVTLRTVHPHRRARVWAEERHRYLPSWLVRPVYRRLVPLPAPPLSQTRPRPEREAG